MQNPRDDWDGSASWDDSQRQPDPAPGAPPGGPPTPEPRPTWRDRVFSNRTARFVASGVPLGMVPTDQGLGLLAAAAQEFGWTVTDSDPQADELLASIPTRIAGYRAGQVVTGRFDPFTDRAASGLPSGEWSFLAFDAVEDSRIGRTVRQCVTAVPSLVALPALRILPGRFPVGRAQGMLVHPTEDPIFDARFRILAAPGEAELAGLNALIDEDVRSALCSGVDNEEVWTHADRILVTTAGPHQEEILARHLAILGAMLRALRRSAH